MLEKLKAIEARLTEVERQLSDPSVYGDRERLTALSREQKELTPVVSAYRAYVRASRTAEDAAAMLPDPELREGVLQAVKRRELSVRETEELVEKTLTALRARPEPLPRVQKETLAVTDIRLLTNSIRQSLSLMERAGMQVELSEAEDGDGYHIAICIKKE